MQNKNKIKQYWKTNKFTFFSHFSTKLLVDFLIITFGIKVLVGVTLFLIPQKTALAEFNTIDAPTLIALTNEAREKQGLAALTPNKLLTSAAEQKADDIIKHNYFAHTTPAGKTFYQWIQEADYPYKSAGENLAISFIKNEDIVIAWLKSRTHRENILDPRYQEIGIAVKTGDFNNKETTVAVQMFGEPLNPRAATILNNEARTLGSKTSNLTATASADQPFFWLYQVNYSLNISLVIALFLLILILSERTLHQWMTRHLLGNFYVHYLQNRRRHIR